GSSRSRRRGARRRRGAGSTSESRAGPAAPPAPRRRRGPATSRPYSRTPSRPKKPRGRTIRTTIMTRKIAIATRCGFIDSEERRRARDGRQDASHVAAPDLTCALAEDERQAEGEDEAVEGLAAVERAQGRDLGDGAERGDEEGCGDQGHPERVGDPDDRDPR